MKPNIAVNLAERLRLRGMREGKTKGWKHQQMLEALSWEVPSITYSPKR